MRQPPQAPSRTRPIAPRPHQQRSLRSLGEGFRRHVTVVMVLVALGYGAFIAMFLSQRYVNVVLIPPAPDLTSAQERQEKLNRPLLERVQASIERKEAFQSPAVADAHDPFTTSLDTTQQNP